MITLEQIEHRQMKCIAIRGRYGKETHERLKGIDALSYSTTHSCYYVKYEESVLEELRTFLSESEIVNVIGFESDRDEKPPTPATCSEVPREYVEQLLKARYSDSTQKNYVSQFRLFLSFISPKNVGDISHEDVNRYLLHLVEVARVSRSKQNIAINAIKFYLEQVKSGERTVYYLERPRKEKRLPTVLSEREMKALLEHTRNLKHRCLLFILYSSGLRISELLNLRLTDIDADRMSIHVRGGKGAKDRITLLSLFAYDFMKGYLAMYKPTGWLFEGPSGGPYSARSVNNIIKRSAKKAGIRKNVSAHTLRHSFATHLLEHGTDLRYIQSLLGHESSRTTEIYAHVTKKGFEQLISPLDRIFGSGNFEDK